MSNERKWNYRNPSTVKPYVVLKLNSTLVKYEYCVSICSLARTEAHFVCCEVRNELPHILTYLLTPRCRVLLKKLKGLQLVKKFPALYGTRRFITALTSVRHLSLSCASPIHSTYPHPTSWRSILILSTHLSLGLPSGLFPSGFPTKTYVNKIGSFMITPKSSNSPATVLEWSRGFQEIKVPRFHDNGTG